uniref:Protein lethal(2)essential for life n=2 Tax=Culex pipiens TaxID=7175 RepID=A0A8D8G8K9_CULPI
MSIIPILFRDSFMDDFLDDFMELPRERFFTRAYPSDMLMAINNLPLRRGYQRSCPYNQVMKENQAKDGSFQVSVDVQHFKPEEISLKMNENYVTVEGKHEEKQDEQGYVFRHFVRKYQLPEGHDLEKVVSSLSSDGVLTIKAPRMALAAAEKEKTIPIVQTGKPAKQIEIEKDKENKKDLK